MRLVENHGICGRQQVGHALVAQHQVGEKKVVVDYHDIRLLRLTPGLHHKTFAIVRTFRTQTILAGGGDLGPDGCLFGDVREFGSVPGFTRLHKAHNRAQVAHILGRSEPSTRLRSAQMVVTHVVGATFQEGDGHGRGKRLAHAWQVPAKQLILQRFGTGRKNDFAAPQKGGNQVGKRLAGSSAGLCDEAGLILDGASDRLRHLQLAFALAVALHLGGERAAL